MTTCCWCTPGGSSTTSFLKQYATQTCPSSEFQTANEDLCFCLECVIEYHKARDELPFYHEVLWELEIVRITNYFEKSMNAELEDDDEVYIVDSNGDAQPLDYGTCHDFENKIRVPLLEILKFPYLLLDERVNELCVEALCRMEQANCSFQVFEKHPGIYLFLVHPNEMVRRWAILTARSLGKVDRDDYYDLQEVLTCLFKVIELGLLENPDIYTSSVLEKGKLILLPSHMYDVTNYKNYWLGICMLLTILEEQAMDSLLLGSDKQNDFMQSILHTMERQSDDDSVDPFWPALHCFMVILDRLGSKVWGQLIDPIEAFQTIINNVSYNREIQTIRRSSLRTKFEPEPHLDDMVTCSQIVYNYNPEKNKKDSGWRSAICPDYCPNMYEEMETLASVLQSDIGQDMRVHNSTFLWFIPFVQSLMDLKDLGVAYIVEVIHHLHSEIKDVLNQTDAVCDKVTEFFLLILVSVIELHRNKKCLHLLWVSSQKWVEAIVKCAKLPTSAFARTAEKSTPSTPKGTPVFSALSLHTMPSNSVQLACVQLIRSLLKEGYQLGQQTLCKRFWDKLNLFLRGNLSLGWQLTAQETHELQLCLKQIIRNIKLKVPQHSALVDLAPPSKSSLASCSKDESEGNEKPRQDLLCLESSRQVLSKELMKADGCQVPEGVSVRMPKAIRENGQTDLKPEDHPSTEPCFKQHHENDLTNRAQEPVQISTEKQEFLEVNSLCSSKNDALSKGSQGDSDRGTIISTHALAAPSSNSLAKGSPSNEAPSLKNNTLGKTFRVTKAQKDEICAKLSHVIKQQHRKSTVVNNNVFNLKETLTVSSIESFYSRKSTVDPQGEDGLFHRLCPDAHNLLDEKNGDQKCSKPSVLQKKQLNKDFDIFSSHKNSYQIQKSGGGGGGGGGGGDDDDDGDDYNDDNDDDNKDLVSRTEMTSFMRKTSALEDPVSRLDAQEAVTSKISKGVSVDLQDQPFSLTPKADALSDSQVDRDIHNLSLLAQVSAITFPSDSSPQSSCQLQRKVREEKRCFTAKQSSGRDAGENQIIIISDSDEEEGEERAPRSEKRFEQANVALEEQEPGRPTPIADTNVDSKAAEEEEAECLQFEDSDSQVFEFETQYDVFSVWQDQQADKNSDPVGKESCSPSHGVEVTNEQVQDAEDASEGAISKAAEDLNEQAEPQSSSSRISVEEVYEIGVKKSKRKRSEKASAGKSLKPSKAARREDPMDIPQEVDLKSKVVKRAKPAPSTSTDSRATAVKKAPSKPGTSSKPVRKGPASKGSKKMKSETKKGSNKSNYISCRTSPAVVLEKKVRQQPEPTSTVEKLGLKKPPRKAVTLSQPSLTKVKLLRNYGQMAGAVDVQKNTKVITPQTHSVRNNKKLLAMQEPCMRRQVVASAPRKRPGLIHSEGTTGREAGPHAAQSSATSGSEPAQSDCRRGMDVFTLSTVAPEEDPVKDTANPPGSDGFCLWGLSSSDRMEGGLRPADWPANPASETLAGPNRILKAQQVAAPKEGHSDSDSDLEEEALFLTQHDPHDMDLCSQMESDYMQGSDIAQREGTAVQASTSPAPPLRSTKCKHKDCVETAQNQGDFCSKHMDNEVFRKPVLLPAQQRPRPSTTKVYSSRSTSRLANLYSSMESSSTTPSSAKSKPSGVLPAQKVLPPPTPPPPPPPPPPPETPLKTPAEVKGLCSVLFSPASSVVFRPPFRPLCAETRVQSADSPVSVLLSSQSITDAFVKEVLKWKHEMFVNFSQYGPPASLCQAITRPVPVRFQNAEDYFSVFFPLVILNTFETVAQEWSSSSSKSYVLLFRKFPADYKKYWEFVVHLDENELAKQLHPKENDLVFLASECRPGERKEFARKHEPESHEYYCGFVHKFRRTSSMRSGKSECCLSIQTQERLPINVNEPVRCVVVSSLVTTQRKLKAMSLLGSRNQLARAILNPNPMDFCTKDLLNTASERIVSYLRDFNEDQKKAIETAYAMVKHSPSVAKICLIHGPPGTGKSKTIVGLLCRLLTESQRRGRSNENSNAKIKQNRVLVCAPSNAAVDELMKKIILEFKEKCKDKKSPQGNCGDINLVRLGPEKSINTEVLRFSLDNQVSHRMKKDQPSHVQEMHRRKECLDRLLDELSRQRALFRGARKIQRQELDEKIARVSKERQELASKIKEVQGRPQRTQSLVILESHIICCTLSTSGGLLLESAFRGQGGMPFSCVIVDEAGQSCEVETLMPLIHRCNKLILVGDPKQLPPTIISMKAQEFGYDQSMMARFYKLLEENVERNTIGRLPIVQLTVQYRMHPDICLFPANYIYNRNLRTNRLTETLRCSSDWPFQPYLVFDVGDGAERRNNESYVNAQEIKLVMEIIKLIKEKRKDLTFRHIGIITHYKAQKTMIQKDLTREFDKKGPAEVDTVDGFQGRQKDCIIVTCVRANSIPGSIGFLSSLQRLNVAITRAKYSLFILGHLRTLMDSTHWNHLIQDAQRRGAIVKTCNRNYRHDALKILKLKKPSLQRSLTHPPAVTPEAVRPQGGLPGSTLDNVSAFYLTPPDSGESVVPAKDPEKSSEQDLPRDPRLLRRLGISLDPRCQSPQPPRAIPGQGEQPTCLEGLPELGDTLDGSGLDLHGVPGAPRVSDLHEQRSGGTFPQRTVGWEKRHLPEEDGHTKRKRLL